MYSAHLPSTLYTAAQVRALDRLAIDSQGIGGFDLMHRAAKAAFALLKQQWPQAQRILVVCGPGNNGGDGYLLACLAQAEGMKVTVFQASDKPPATEEARQARLQWLGSDGLSLSADDRGSLSMDVDVIVDALLGTGLQRNLEGDWVDLIKAINQADLPVLAIDIPSGLNADSGAVMGIAVQATSTLSFIGIKRGMQTAQGPDVCGQLFFADLGVADAVYKQVPSTANVLNETELAKVLPARPQTCHKGRCGHALLIGGERGMAGAVGIAGAAAARVGAGLVSVATRPEHVGIVNTPCPELMCHGIDEAAQLVPLLNKATLVAIGPGLGQGAWAQSLLEAVLESQLYLVVDADALNLIAKRPYTRGRWILTPHPGEAARLLDTTTAAVQRDRFAAIESISERYNCITVLKGNGTVIQAGQDTPRYVCRHGNPGMATAGMGDMLTGIIAGLLAQGLSLVDAARFGVLVHALAADRAARAGERGLMATDLLVHLRALVNPAQGGLDDGLV